jgi:hypothetical protein
MLLQPEVFRRRIVVTGRLDRVGLVAARRARSSLLISVPAAGRFEGWFWMHQLLVAHAV